MAADRPGGCLDKDCVHHFLGVVFSKLPSSKSLSKKFKKIEALVGALVLPTTFAKLENILVQVKLPKKMINGIKENFRGDDPASRILAFSESGLYRILKHNTPFLVKFSASLDRLPKSQLIDALATTISAVEEKWLNPLFFVVCYGFITRLIALEDSYVINLLTQYVSSKIQSYTYNQWLEEFGKVLFYKSPQHPLCCVMHWITTQGFPINKKNSDGLDDIHLANICDYLAGENRVELIPEYIQLASKGRGVGQLLLAALRHNAYDILWYLKQNYSFDDSFKESVFKHAISTHSIISPRLLSWLSIETSSLSTSSQSLLAKELFNNRCMPLSSLYRLPFHGWPIPTAKIYIQRAFNVESIQCPQTKKLLQFVKLTQQTHMQIMFLLNINLYLKKQKDAQPSSFHVLSLASLCRVVSFVHKLDHNALPPIMLFQDPFVMSLFALDLGVPARGMRPN